MDWQLLANKNGHIACTHGGESLAGLVNAKEQGLLGKSDIAVLNSTAHALKFSNFQEMYFNGAFPAEFEISPDTHLITSPMFVRPKQLEKVPEPGKPLKGKEFDTFVKLVSKEIARYLNLKEN